MSAPAERPANPLLADAPVTALPRGPFAFLWFLIRTHAPARVAAMVALAGLASLFDAYGPYVLRGVINAMTRAVESGGTSFALILPWLATLALVWGAGSALYRAFEYADLRTGPELRLLAQGYLFSYLLGHSPRYFQDTFAGKLGQKVKQAGQSTIAILSILAFEAVRVVTLIAAGSVMLALEHWQYAALLVLWCAVYLAVVQRLARACVRHSKTLSDEVSTSTGRLIDAITNADLIRAFAKSAFERRFLAGFLDRERDASHALRGFLIGMRAFMSTATILMQLSLIALAARDTLAGALSVGSFAMVFLLANLIARSIQELSYRMLDFFEQLGTLAEALELVSEPHEIKDEEGAARLVVREGAILFDHVSFRHPDGSAVFCDLTLAIAGGEKVGLVGRSGAGKSTLVKLLRRQFEPQGGRILIDGQDITKVNWDSVNEAIAEVPQATGVFHRPVGENIRYARLEAAREEIEEAARAAHAHDFITARREGYQTIVGEQGIKLSGGERQRIAIARAFIKDAPILVLDEATSALDSESEHRIQAALFDLMKGRTVIAIAHRLSTLVGMDRIVVLDRGEIVEEGSHAELLAREGAYARLWRTQVGGFIQA
ncbi:MAG: ABC transporter ATP-binding protein [Alphaproteobacteria bacterium]|nr:ABC transporter ATP-binding protein [Alphaproteobacteria bacterium]